MYGLERFEVFQLDPSPLLKVGDRLQNNKTDFMAPIPKQTVRKFTSMNKLMMVKTQDKVESVILMHPGM